MRKIIAILVLMAMLTLPMGMAQQYAYTRIRYTVPETVQFTIDMPGYAAGAGNISTETFPGNSTLEMWFNASNANSKDVTPCTFGGSECQVQDVAPILNFTNTGTSSFNISMRLDTAQDATLIMAGNFSYPPGSGPAGGCAEATLAANDTVIGIIPFNFTRALCISNTTSVWLRTNFTNTPSGTISNYLNYTSRA